VVAPAPRNLQISRREALEPKAGALHEGDRRDVLWLDVRLDPMEPHGDKGMPQHELQALRHVALAVERTLGVVPHVCALKEAADNLVQHENADDRSVLDPADKEAVHPWLPLPFHPLGEGRVIGRWRDPATMDRTTRKIPRDELFLVPPGWLAQVDAFADFEGVFEIRLAHVEPNFAKPR
jgi:hypothetical protein